MSETIFRVLVINPGSTSTKLAVYENDSPLFETVLRHGTAALLEHKELDESLAFRQQLIEEALREHGVQVSSRTSDAIVPVSCADCETSRMLWVTSVVRSAARWTERAMSAVVTPW